MKTYKADWGESVEHAAREMAKIAAATNEDVTCKFNDVVLTTNPGELPQAIVERFYAETDRLREEWLESPEYKQQQEEHDRKERDRQSSLASELADAPEYMTLRDPDGWQEACAANTDGYSGAVMSYAERWARLMEGRMSKGERIADIADECLHLANNEGITGYMYGCAVSILAQVWIHGEALRMWHNLKTQIGNEGEQANESGGVLNPALLKVE